MKHTLVKLRNLGLMAMVAAAIAGCGGGGGSDGAPGATVVGPTGTPGAAGGGTSVAALSTTDFQNLAVSTDNSVVTGVTINSPPAVTFTVKDGSGNGITGLENNWSTAAVGDTVRTYRNVALSIAKFVPGSNGSPGRWVSYIVTTMPSTGTGVGVTPTGNETPTALTRPTTDNTGLLEAVAGSPGTYKYTFRRDITKVAAYAASTTDTTTNKKADLDDLSFAKDGTTTYRVAVQISGPARGTGNNTADGVTVAPGAYMKTPVDIIYDFKVNADGTSTPAANPRDIVKVAACMSCHNKFQFHGPSGVDTLAGYGGSRQDTRMCSVCHTDQRKFGRTEVVRDATGFVGSMQRIYDRSPLNLPTFIHMIHMGDRHVLTNVTPVVAANDIKYPQMITNCTKCHDGTPTAATPTGVAYSTPLGDNWKNVPSRLACGGCHVGINFATGAGTNVDGSTTGHGKSTGLGGAQASDANCVTCHSAAAINTVHIPVSPPNSANALLLGGTNTNTNAAWIAGNSNNLPVGAIKVTYDIKSVSRDSNKNPTMTFRMLQNGVAVPFNTYNVTTPLTRGSQEMWTNFIGSPSAYFVYSVPQDGIAAPTDFNASANSYLRSIWNGKTAATAATLAAGTGADAGYYVVTLKGTIIPDNAVMLTGGLGYTYTVTTSQPLTQTNVVGYPVATATATGLDADYSNKTGGLIVIAPDAQKIGTGYTARRVIVEDARCNSCHAELGVFNDASFHAGQRNDGTTCAWCHTANRTSSGWYVDSTDFVHAIHGNSRRVIDAPLSTYDVANSGRFTWHASVIADATNPVAPDGQYYATDGSAYASKAALLAAGKTPGKLEDFSEVGYPGVLKNCEACHVPGSYDFSNTTNKTQAASKLFRTTATGYYSGTPGQVIKSFSGSTCAAATAAQTALGVYSLSPYVTKDNATFYGQVFSYNASATAASVVCNLDAAGSKATLPAATLANAATAAGVAGNTYPNDAASFSSYGKTLVNSPLATVCVSCHLKTATWAHIKANGGSLFQKRETVFNSGATLTAAPNVANLPAASVEQCFVCHSTGGTADIKAMHSK